MAKRKAKPKRSAESRRNERRQYLLKWLEENVVTPHLLHDMPYWHFLSTTHWARLREATLERDGACTNCGATEDLKAVHVPGFDWGRRGHETVDDLRCLCAACGKAAHDEAAEEADAEDERS